MELRLGEKQTLVIVKKVEFGVYLATKEAPEDKVLLPAKQVPEGAKVGDELEVFLYRDSNDRLISTTRTPKLCMGQVALLTVVQVGKVGAFLDWGLEKDLLLPFKQQTRKVKTGEQVLAALYIDKSGRLCATMNVYEHLRTDSPYKKDDKVTGRIYEISKNFGAFVAVDNCFSGLIPKKELFGDTELRIGEYRVYSPFRHFLCPSETNSRAGNCHSRGRSVAFSLSWNGVPAAVERRFYLYPCHSSAEHITG